MIASRRSGMVPFPVERRRALFPPDSRALFPPEICRALFPPEIPLYHPVEDVIYCII